MSGGDDPLPGRAPDAVTTDDDVAGSPAPVTVYWRPGGPYCARLRRGLRRAGVVTEEVDIWADPDAAAVVRRAARGNETVPTVAVGGRFLVNPSVAEVLAASGRLDAARDAAPARPGLLRALRRRWARPELG